MADDDSTYQRLRRMVLDLDPVAAPTTELPRVWGALMDTGYPNGTATVVCLVDGTTSLYTSTGGGILGAGAHERVAVPSRHLLTVVEKHLNQMPPSTEDTLPDPDWVVMRALTYTDRPRGTGRGGRPRLQPARAGRGVPRLPRRDHSAAPTRRPLTPPAR